MRSTIAQKLYLRKRTKTEMKQRTKAGKNVGSNSSANKPSYEGGTPAPLEAHH